MDEKDRTHKRIKIIDIKTRWSVHSFFKHYTGEMEKKDEAQLQGYCILAECEKAEIANVLTNNSPKEIARILKREAFNWDNPEDDDSIEFDLPTWKKIEILKRHVFDKETLDFYLQGEFLDEDAKAEYDSFVEIPLSERVIREEWLYNAEMAEQIEEAIEKAIKYLQEVWNVWDHSHVVG